MKFLNKNILLRFFSFWTYQEITIQQNRLKSLKKNKISMFFIRFFGVKFISINDTEYTLEEDKQKWEEFLNKLYPNKSSFEL